MPIDRTNFDAWEDDDGTGTTGTVLDKATMAEDILDPIDAALAPVARVDLANTFNADQTINGDLFVTGEINPARLAAQRSKIDQLIGPGSGRTLLSDDLTAGMSLVYDGPTSQGKVTVGNYDTQTYQSLALEADAISLSTGVFPPGMSEHVRVHPSGGVTVGDASDHATDPGTGVLVAQGGLSSTPLNADKLTSGTLPDARTSVNVLKHLGGYPGGTANFLRADGQFAAPPGGTALTYTEAAWTPSLGGSSGQSGGSYAAVQGRYTRIGRMIFAEWYLALATLPTISGYLILRGLPFAATGVQSNSAVTYRNLATNWITISLVAEGSGNVYAVFNGQKTAATDHSNDKLSGTDLKKDSVLGGLLIYSM